MPKWDYKNEPCAICKTKITEMNMHPYCNKCNKIIVYMDREIEFGNTPQLLIKAQKLHEAYNNDILTVECFITKRDRLLLLLKRAQDKYLTKLKKEVDKI